MWKRLRIARSATLLGIAIICTLSAGLAVAASINIVALGASNTNGRGVGRALAWPAQLEDMLRAKGYAAHVTNEGIDGDTTRGMLSRLNSAVPDGTQIVILDKTPSTDRDKGVTDSAANISAIVGQLRARGVKSIIIASNWSWGGFRLQPDHQHLTAEGHALLAARLLPMVIASLGKAR
jgi:acyl-CoA thioesterase-1